MRTRKKMAIEHKFRGYTATNQRRDRRVPVELAAIVDDEEVIIKDIGFGGMGFIAEDADLELGDEVIIEIDLSGGKHLKIDGLIVRFDGTAQFGIIFSGLTPDAFAAIEKLQTNLGQRRSADAPQGGVKTSSAGV